METKNITEFEKEVSDLDFDINNINTRLDQINSNIILLQTNINRLTAIILNTSSGADKSSYYKVQSEILKTLSLFNSNYQQLLDLKFKYRTQKNEYKLKISKYFEIELKKIDESESEVPYSNVLRALNKLASSIDSTEPNTSNSVKLSYEPDEII